MQDLRNIYQHILPKHNAGEVPHTSKFQPQRIQTAVAFDSKEKAVAFGDHLKSGSGRDFAKRRILHIKKN